MNSLLFFFLFTNYYWHIYLGLEQESIYRVFFLTMHLLNCMVVVEVNGGKLF